MSRNESTTRKELIEPALTSAGWAWTSDVQIGPGRVNITGDSMYDESQSIIADYVLRCRQLPLAVLEAKAELESAADGIQQGSRYARRLGIRFTIATNGREYLLTDTESGDLETLSAPPTPAQILHKLGIDIDWDRWAPALETPWHIDQVTRKNVRPYQEMAITKVICAFASGRRRALLLMATGTGKTFTVFQLVWKLAQSGVLPKGRVLFLTDRNSLKDQAYRAFASFAADERVVIDKDTVSAGRHRIGKVFFANYQNLDEELDGKKLFEHYEPDFFDLVIVDECHRSGFGDWFGVFEHFKSAYQLGLTATPRELDQQGVPLTDAEKRRDTYEYFGDPIYTYSLRQAIEDGYLVPYLLEERVTNLDAAGFTAPDGKTYDTANFERDIRMPDRTKFIAEDLWALLGQYALRDEKTIVFCVDDTHAAFMAQELRRVSGDPDYAARITRSERNSHMLERTFAEVGRAKPRVAVTVDLLTTGFDAPDVKNIVFARPIKSSILYKQMKGRGTRLCEDIDKRYFTIFDYVGAASLEDAEFDGHPANVQKSKAASKKKPSTTTPTEKPIGNGATLFLSASERYVCLADGRKIPFDDYVQQSKAIIRKIAPSSVADLLKLWVDRSTRRDIRAELVDQDIHLAAFRHFLDLEETDDVDILSKVGFDLPRVPARHDRVVRFWDQDSPWLIRNVGEDAVPEPERFKSKVWETSLDHYALFGIDDLEKGATYSAPQFVEQFGSFSSLLARYGGASALKADLEAVKQHLYVPMIA